MREVDDWTPAAGWRIAMRRTLVRGGLGALVAGAVVYGMYGTTEAISMILSLVVVTAVSFGSVGFFIAMAVTRNMDDATGLAGGTLFLPVTGSLLALVGAAMLAAVAVRGWQWNLGLWGLVGGIAVWVFLTCVLFLLAL